MVRLGLILAGIALLAAAAYHIMLIFGAPAWAAFAGAPPEVVQSLEQGTLLAPVSIVFIAAALVVMAAYGFSAAGLISRMPLLKLGLWVIALVFLVRGAAIIPQALSADFSERFDQFHLFASLVVLFIALAYLAGAIRPPPGHRADE